MENILKACEENKVKKLLVTLCIANVVGNVFKYDKKDEIYSHKDIAPIEPDMDMINLSKMK